MGIANIFKPSLRMHSPPTFAPSLARRSSEAVSKLGKAAFSVLVFILLWSDGVAQDGELADTKFLQTSMRKHPEQFKTLLDKRKTFDIQIIYTQIDRDQHNTPRFKTFHYQVDSARYFYPASTVKFPMVLLALEKLNALNHPLVNKYTPIFHDSVYSGQSWSRTDTTAEGGAPSIAHYAKKIFVVSDNVAFNRLYEWLGQAEANNQLQKKGYNVRLLHRLDRRLTPDENRHTEAIRFAIRDSIVYQQPMLVGDSIIVKKKITKGKGYYEKGALIKKPFDMTYRNFFSLPDQHEMLKATIFPGSVPETKRFNLRPDDRQFVLQYMSQLPTETIYPPYYKDTVYTDAYSKFLLYGGDTTRIPKNIRIFNKVGLAYGYVIDNAYIVDFDARVEFMLSAVIYTNEDGIFNDDKYEYDTVAFPFMKNIGQLIYDYESAREKKYPPDLSEFILTYDFSRER
jgi:Beta-lactamase enzyme family